MAVSKLRGGVFMKCFITFYMVLMILVFQDSAFAVNIRDAVYNTKNAGKVVFTHATHMNEKDMSHNCRACHDSIYDLRNKKTYTMADMEQGRSCGACHNGKKAFSLNECASCHKTKDKIYKVKATGTTRFSHKNHLAKSPDCNACHPLIYNAGLNKRFTMKQMEKGKSCGACHDNKKAFGLDKCVSCHPVKEVTYEVKETGPTHFSHSLHMKTASCSKCHPTLYQPNHKNKRVSMAAMEKGKSCGACHDSKKAFPIKSCTRCHPVKELVFEDKDAGNIPFSHKFHADLYTCADCHKKIYETKRSKIKVSMKKMEEGKSCGACHDGKTAFSVKGKCEACHKM
jgi:c(7)-type cytochrome triheme protein